MIMPGVSALLKCWQRRDPWKLLDPLLFVDLLVDRLGVDLGLLGRLGLLLLGLVIRDFGLLLCDLVVRMLAHGVVVVVVVQALLERLCQRTKRNCGV